tara:strand:+ start:1185 stop:1823 length:639 start_codon:yes stop_codon:yes gene_type:complete
MVSFVVIPAFNEQDTIENVVKTASNHVQNIIVVNDCSTDNTEKLSLSAGAKVISLKKNKGYDFALEEGINFALINGATSILTLDADGQHPESSIKPMINLINNENYDLVIGIRNEIPRLSEKIFAFFTNIIFGVEDITCGMKCYRAELLKKYGFGSKHKSLGTYLSLKVLKKSLKYKKFYIPVKRREDRSRIGMNIYAEFDIIWVMIKSIFY